MDLGEPLASKGLVLGLVGGQGKTGTKGLEMEEEHHAGAQFSVALAGPVEARKVNGVFVGGVGLEMGIRMEMEEDLTMRRRCFLVVFQEDSVSEGKGLFVEALGLLFLSLSQVAELLLLLADADVEGVHLREDLLLRQQRHGLVVLLRGLLGKGSHLGPVSFPVVFGLVALGPLEIADGTPHEHASVLSVVLFSLDLWLHRLGFLREPGRGGVGERGREERREDRGGRR